MIKAVDYLPRKLMMKIVEMELHVEKYHPMLVLMLLLLLEQ
jgi:hypothetical protein